MDQLEKKREGAQITRYFLRVSAIYSRQLAFDDRAAFHTLPAELREEIIVLLSCFLRAIHTSRNQQRIYTGMSHLKMELSIVYIFWVIGTVYVDAMCIFQKYYQQKLAINGTTTYAVKGVLDCEKLCLELADSCLAVNVIYKDGNYICDVIANTTYGAGLLERPRIGNLKGKLIIKRGKQVNHSQTVRSRRARRQQDKINSTIVTLTEIPSKCKSDTCQNGGSCLDTRLGYKCVCTSYFVGVNCQLCKYNAQVIAKSWAEQFVLGTAVNPYSEYYNTIHSLLDVHTCYTRNTR